MIGNTRAQPYFVTLSIQRSMKYLDQSDDEVKDTTEEAAIPHNYSVVESLQPTNQKAFERPTIDKDKQWTLLGYFSEHWTQLTAATIVLTVAIVALLLAPTATDLSGTAKPRPNTPLASSGAEKKDYTQTSAHSSPPTSQTSQANNTTPASAPNNKVASSEPVTGKTKTSLNSVIGSTSRSAQPVLSSATQPLTQSPLVTSIVPPAVAPSPANPEPNPTANNPAPSNPPSDRNIVTDLLSGVLGLLP